MERTGMRCIIAPWEVHHLRLWARVRFGAAVILLVVTVLALSIGWVSSAEPWLGVILLVATAGNVFMGNWLLSVARSD
jgi:hypothetical protein